MFSGSDSEIIYIAEEEASERLDKILAKRYKEIHSRAYFQTLIAEQNVLVNSEPVKKRVKLIAGDEIEIRFVIAQEIKIVPEPIPLNILFEDEHLLVINKPPGMVVHPAPGHWSGTFVNAFLYYCKDYFNDQPSLRPGIVHRLDKDTSGLLIAAKTMLAQQRLTEMFAARKIYKEYFAICLGNPGKGKIDLPIGRHPTHRQKMAIREFGKPAVTFYETLDFNGQLSTVKLILATGRTHQIRVHMECLRTPVLGDTVYGKQKLQAKRQMLHARVLKLDHPITRSPLTFQAPIPLDMRAFVQGLILE
jgi:23S rRNA pseudouridine1911/1915/1917 synthase